MEILDGPNDSKIETNRILSRILLLALVSIVIFLLIEEIRLYIQNIKIPGNNLEFSLVGILIFGVLGIIINQLVKQLNVLYDDRNELTIAMFCGLFVLIVEIAFKTIQRFIHFPDGYELELLKYLRVGIIMGSISILFANYRIRKLRNKETTIAKWVFFFGLMIIGYGVKKIILKQ